MREERRWAVEMAIKARMETEELIPVAREILEFLDGDRAAPQKVEEKPRTQVYADLREAVDPGIASVEKSLRAEDLLAAAGLAPTSPSADRDKTIATMLSHRLGLYLANASAMDTPRISIPEAEVLLRIMKKALS